MLLAEQISSRRSVNLVCFLRTHRSFFLSVERLTNQWMVQRYRQLRLVPGGYFLVCCWTDILSIAAIFLSFSLHLLPWISFYLFQPSNQSGNLFCVLTLQTIPTLAAAQLFILGPLARNCRRTLLTQLTDRF